MNQTIESQKPTDSITSTPETGENPQQIGDSVAQMHPKKWERIRKRTPQNERLQKAIQLLQENAEEVEKKELLNSLLKEKAKEPSKTRLKIIYQAEKKLQEWGLMPKDIPLPPQKPIGKSTPQEKPTKSPIPRRKNKHYRNELLLVAKRIEEKIYFFQEAGIQLKSESLYRELQQETAAAFALPPQSQATAFKRLLTKAVNTEKNIMEEGEPILLKKKTSFFQKLKNWWFHTKLVLFIYLLLPERQWPKAIKHLREKTEGKEFESEGKAMLQEAANHLENKMKKCRQTKESKVSPK